MDRTAGPTCQVGPVIRLPLARGEAGREIADAEDMGHQLTPATEIRDQDGGSLGLLGSGNHRLRFLGREDRFRARGVDRGSVVKVIVDLLELIVVVGLGIDERGGEKSSSILPAGLSTNVLETEGVPVLFPEDVALGARVVVGRRVEAVVVHEHDGLLDVAVPGPNARNAEPLGSTVVGVQTSTRPGVGRQRSEVVPPPTTLVLRTSERPQSDATFLSNASYSPFTWLPNFRVNGLSSRSQWKFLQS